MFRWWAFIGAFAVGLPMLVMDSWKSPAHGYFFKGYMVVAFIANLVNIIHCIRRKRRLDERRDRVKEFTAL